MKLMFNKLDEEDIVVVVVVFDQYHNKQIGSFLVESPEETLRLVNHEHHIHVFNYPKYKIQL
jgi:hypothetical protein